MGFRFRKSAKFGPFRINFSKSGVGYSFGGKGFRVTKKAGGGTRTTASIPGTGISYVKDYGKGRKTSRKSQATTTSTPARDLPSVPTRPMSQTMFRVMHTLSLAICVILALCAVIVADVNAPGPAIVLAVIALLFLRSFFKMPARQQASIEYWEAFDAGVLPSDNTADADLTSFDDTEPPAKKPFYKRPWFVALVIILLLGAVGNACSSDDTDQADAEATQQEETVLPEEDAATPEEIDATIYNSVISADSRMDSLNDAILQLAAGSISEEDVAAACKVANAVCQTSLDNIAPYEEDEATAAYAKAAVDAVNNVYAAHIKMENFLSDGEQEDLEYALGCLENRNAANIAFVAARQAYLTDAGFSAEEIAGLNDALGISSESTEAQDPTTQDTSTESEAPEATASQNTSVEAESQNQNEGTVAPVTPPASTQESQPATQPVPDPAPQTNEQKTGYVGSIDSDKYHSPGCRWAKKILPENEIWFESKEAAQAAGYSPCGTCQ